MRLLPRPTWLTRRIPLSRLLRAAPHGAVHHTSTSNAAPVEVPKLLVKPGSVHHNSLSSYLEYAARMKLRTDRTVYIGTHYEYTASEALLRLGFSLIRTGQKNDAGIDLIGHWMLSFLREPMPVIVQCKSRIKSCSPHEIRELEGAFHSVPPDWRRLDVLGLLISTQKATAGMRRQMYLSTRPLAFMLMNKDGTVTQFIWNRAATERGLEGVGVTARYTVVPPEIGELDSVKSDPYDQAYENGDRPRNEKGMFVPDPLAKTRRKRVAESTTRTVITDIQLTWLGTPVSPDKEHLAQETARRIAAIVRARETAKEEATAMLPPVKRGRPEGSKNGVRTPRGWRASQMKKLMAKEEVMATAPARRLVFRGEFKAGRPSWEVSDVFEDDGSGEILTKPFKPRRKQGRPQSTGEIGEVSDQKNKVAPKRARLKKVEAVPATPRKRERPKKILAAPVAATPRGRGRPKKIDTEPVTSPRQGKPPKVEAVPATPRKRGRPRKTLAVPDD